MKNAGIEKLYGAMREREEGTTDMFLRNYYAGYCDALETVYIFLEGGEGQRKREVMKGIEEMTKAAEEIGKEPPEEPKEPSEKQKEPSEKPKEDEQAAEEPEETGAAEEEGKYLKICKQCGREFRTNTNQRIYCPECSGMRKKEAQRESKERNKKRYAELRKKRREAAKKAGKKPEPKKTGPVEIRCQQCGKLISTSPSCRKKYCDDCIKKRKAESKRREREQTEAGFSFAKENRKKQAKTNEALNEMARIQKETGISYGQQMARKWQKEEKR